MDKIMSRILTWVIAKNMASFMSRNAKKRLMRGVVTSLHMLSAEHEVITTSGLEGLHKVCEDCLRETIESLEEVANLTSRQEQGPEPSWSMPIKFCGATSVAEPGSYDLYISGSRRQQVLLSNLSLTKPQETSLPFIGYTFKRFESNYNPPIVQTAVSKPENQNARPDTPSLHAPSGLSPPLNAGSYMKKAKMVKPRYRDGRNRKTRRGISGDESEFRNFQSATTRATRTGSGDNDDNITIKVIGNAWLMVGGAQIDYDDGGEIEIKSRNVERTSSKRSSEFGAPSRDFVSSPNVSFGEETLERPGGKGFRTTSISTVSGPVSSGTSGGINVPAKTIHDSSLFRPAIRQNPISHDAMSDQTRPPTQIIPLNFNREDKNPSSWMAPRICRPRSSTFVEREFTRPSYYTSDQNTGSAFENFTSKPKDPAGENLKVEDDSIALGLYTGFDNAFGGSSSRPLESRFDHRATRYTFGASPRTDYHAHASDFATSPKELPPSYSDYEYSDDDMEAAAGLNAMRVAQEQDSGEGLPDSPAYSPTSPGNSPKGLGERGNASTDVNFPENVQHTLSFGGPAQDNKQPKKEESSDFWYSAFQSMRNSKEMGYMVLSNQLETLGIETHPHP
ncbi:hypothetical protein HYALB_00012410 [Hymenoscyphus albidus]|uniref:Uncharacterized protein n=1 Tax=Hymenoscyphus albidus TaxID=595503 RepID=A0A9N9LSX5_9HELO|nr:hypothetical protein HYALB_00012410 [Hymenoscyphus albidus]